METERKIGHLAWVATDKTHEVIDEGEKDVVLADVEITVCGNFLDVLKVPCLPKLARGHRVQHSKMIELSDQFSFGTSGGASEVRAESSGFGFTARRLIHEDTGSWEWFNIDGSEHATKHQETGEVAMKIEKVGKVWEVVRTEFLTDVSIRIARMGVEAFKLSNKGFGIEFDWRVRILKGSVVLWPSLIDGETVANGYL
ncbi:MAG: hypothetical protein IH944_01240 [Armatimonadetes bacterium]|nr:hypothetical protein [Armatimonadota bacterium]